MIKYPSVRSAKGILRGCGGFHRGGSIFKGKGGENVLGTTGYTKATAKFLWPEHRMMVREGGNEVGEMARGQIIKGLEGRGLILQAMGSL